MLLLLCPFQVPQFFLIAYVLIIHALNAVEEEIQEVNKQIREYQTIKEKATTVQQSLVRSSRKLMTEIQLCNFSLWSFV